MKTYHDIVSDGGSGVAEQVGKHASRVEERLAQVTDVVAIMSGKGGVGKSTLTVNLAAALARRGCAVGVLDADINGPSIAKMMGVRGHTPMPADGGMTPAMAALGIRVMSIDLFLPQGATPVLWNAPSQHSAYTWRSMMDMAAFREMLSDTQWGALDVLLIDLPPGADKLPNVADIIPTLSGALVITGPSEVSQMVVARSITMATEIADVPVLGLVENMGPVTCRRCGHEEELFPGVGAEGLSRDLGVPYWGRIPFDPKLAHMADTGGIFVDGYPDAPAATAIYRLARALQEHLASARIGSLS